MVARIVSGISPLIVIDIVLEITVKVYTGELKNF
jgi:hypothetical protein